MIEKLGISTKKLSLYYEIQRVYGINESHEIIPYNTNIYTLYNQMFRDGDPESVDILQLLKEHEQNDERKNYLIIVTQTFF